MHVEFSTENADYYLVFGRHEVKTEIEKKIDNFDALVLESGFNAYEDWKLDGMKEASFGKLVSKNLKIDEPRPIFFVDLPDKREIRSLGEKGYDKSNAKEWREVISPLFFISIFPLFSPIFFLPFILYSTTDVAKPNRIIKYLSLFNGYTDSSYRSAITAYKLEEFIGPELKRRKKMKPYILLHYGSWHKDIQPYCEHKWLRNIIINFHEKIKKNFNWCDRSYRNKVYEFNFSEGGDVSPDARKKIMMKRKEKFYTTILYQV